MADSLSYPYPSHNFNVIIDTGNSSLKCDGYIGFNEVNGVESRAQYTTYYEGGNKNPIPFVDNIEYGNVTLRYGIDDDNFLFKWHKNILQNGRDFSSLKFDVTISAQNFGSDTLSLVLKGAWPSAVRLGDFNSMQSGILINETVLYVTEISYFGCSSAPDSTCSGSS